MGPEGAPPRGRLVVGGLGRSQRGEEDLAVRLCSVKSMVRGGVVSRCFSGIFQRSGDRNDE